MINANGFLACLMLAYRQNTLQGMLGVLVERFEIFGTGSTNDLPRHGRPRVITRGQNSYIMNRHLRNRFQTATVTAANTHS